MQFCKDHVNKAYTTAKMNKLIEGNKLCKHSGKYQGVDDNLVRVYCFVKLDKGVCPHEKKKDAGV